MSNESTQREQTSADAEVSSSTESDPAFESRSSDPDVCRICPKMLWMHYLVGVSDFAKYGTNRPLIV